jgi:hypothetical protein
MAARRANSVSELMILCAGAGNAPDHDDEFREELNPSQGSALFLVVLRHVAASAACMNSSRKLP